MSTPTPTEPTASPRLVRVLLLDGGGHDWPGGVVRYDPPGLVWVTDPVDGARVGYPLARVRVILDGPADAMPSPGSPPD
jgi:hypothetical protein